MNIPPRKAVAYITGGPLAPQIKGTVVFSTVPGGTQVAVEVQGLPPYKPAGEGKAQVGPHGFHIHESPDDYRTQPAGASGRKLACGVIQKVM